MADVDNPKTHVEDQVERGEVDLPRTQPESPHREGIDPLTEGDTMYPAEDTKTESEKLDRKQEKKAAEDVENADDAEPSKTEQTVADQEERDVKAATPNSNLPDEDKTDTTAQRESASEQDTSPAKDNAGQDLPQTAKPASTNPAGERGKETSSDASKKTTK